jgi:hypothetical protein
MKRILLTRDVPQIYCCLLFPKVSSLSAAAPTQQRNLSYRRACSSFEGEGGQVPGVMIKDKTNHHSPELCYLRSSSLPFPPAVAPRGVPLFHRVGAKGSGKERKQEEPSTLYYY